MMTGETRASLNAASADSADSHDVDSNPDTEINAGVEGAANAVSDESAHMDNNDAMNSDPVKSDQGNGAPINSAPIKSAPDTSDEPLKKQSSESFAASNADSPAPSRPVLTVVTDSSHNNEQINSANDSSHGSVDRPAVIEKLVHEGDDGWLFLVAGSNHVLNMYRHKSSFTPSMAKGWVKLLQERSSRLARQGIQYLHLPAPEKLTVLHKFYRGEIEHIEGSPIHQMAQRHAADVPCMVNVLPFFERQTDNTLLYWKTDTHWSFWGCFSAYQLLCNRIGVSPNTELLKYPFSSGPVLFDLGAKLDPPTKETARFYQLTQNAQRVYANPIVRFKEEQGLINEANLHVGSAVVYQNRSAKAIDKCVVLFGDSFSEYRDHLLTGMLAETFREVHFIWNASIDYNYLERVKPDIVVTELAERFMTRIPEDKLDIKRFATGRLKAFQPDVEIDETSSKFAMPKSIIIEKPILPTETYHLEPPRCVQEACENEGNDTAMQSTPINLVEVRNSKVFFTGDRLLVRAPGGEVVSRYGVSDEEFAEMPWIEHRKIQGTSLMLGNSMGAHCYYHWMLDLLPKLGMLKKAGISLCSIDHFLVREMNTSFHKETLERLGIDASRVVETKKDHRIECEKLLLINIDNGVNMRMNRFIPTWMKHLYPPEYPVGSRIKLYISRPEGVRRGVANEAELLPILRKAGYTISPMEGLSVNEQSQLLARADVVISPHGGALTNMVFCQPGIKIVELFGRHVYPFYYGLAQMCGHEYHAIVENSEDYPRLIKLSEARKVGSAAFQKQTRENSFNVDVDAFKATLAALD